MVQRDRRFKQRKGVELLVDRAFDARHQRGVDFLQFRGLSLQRLDLVCTLLLHDG